MARMPDGTLACGDADGGIRLWDIAADRAQRPVRTGQAGTGHSVSGLQVLPDGRLAYSVYRQASAFVWDPKDGRETPIALLKPSLWAEVLATLADGRLALIDSHNVVVLWDPRTGRTQPAVDVEREESGVGCVSSLADGRLAIGMGHGPIKVWRLA